MVVSYKGFDKDLKCRDFQYELNKDYVHEGEVKACLTGFHACEYPLDVFGYYPPATSRYALVEQSVDLSRDDDDSKIASRNISIKMEIAIPYLVKMAIEYTTSRCSPIDPESPAFNSKERGASTNSGYGGASTNSGDYGASTNSGTRGASTNSGYGGASTNSGERGASTNSGYGGVAAGFGSKNKARSCAGGAIVLVNRNDDGDIVHIRASMVGDNGIKADVWYMLDDNGEFVEVSE